MAAAAARVAGEEADDNVDAGDDAADNGHDDAADAVDNGHDALADRPEDGFDLCAESVSIGKSEMNLGIGFEERRVGDDDEFRGGLGGREGRALSHKRLQHPF